MIRRVAVFGAGTMGGGIAVTCLKAGLPVTVIDTTAAALERVRVRIDAHLQREVEKGRMTAPEAEEAAEHLSLTEDPGRAAAADLVIEAVFEDLAVKRNLMSAIEPLLRPDAVIATNTSCLLVGDVAKALARPGRFLGLHYFSPAEISPIVEVISAGQTRPEVVEQALDFLRRTGKAALPCKDSPGFALNRFFCPYCNEAVRLLDEGVATTGQIDAVACASLGLGAGPFRVMNLTKPSIMLHAMQSLAPLGPFYTPAKGLQAIGQTGALWAIEETPAMTEPATAALIADRLAGAALKTALEALAEGVCQAEDLDRGAREALRFARNPVVLQATLPASEITRILATVGG